MDAERDALRRERAELLEDGPRQIKRRVKTLRQVEQLQAKIASGEVDPNEEQRDKVARLPQLAAELAELEARLAAARLADERGEDVVVAGHGDSDNNNGGDGGDADTGDEDGTDTAHGAAAAAAADADTR